MHDQPKYGEELQKKGLHQLSLLRPLLEIIDGEVCRHPITGKATISHQLTFDYGETYGINDVQAMIDRLTEAIQYQSSYGKEILIIAWLSWTIHYQQDGEQKEILYTCAVKVLDTVSYLFKQQYGTVSSYDLDVRSEVPAEKILELIRNVHKVLDEQTT